MTKKKGKKKRQTNMTRLPWEQASSNENKEGKKTSEERESLSRSCKTGSERIGGLTKTPRRKIIGRDLYKK